ncbi:MAG: hypothetical protein IJO06_11975 [Thermoguttaceae bacterium]|nr:hypothetical protein [Thermoguttaceae bacterium]
MTQQNDAAERAQNVNEPFDAATDVADESFAQEWLNAEGIGNAEEAPVAPRSQVVATLPDWTTFSNRTDERRERWDWREILSGGVLRTSSVALAAFGLGVFCATGWRGDETAAVDAEIVANETELRNENADSFENAADETSLGALATIDSTTLRSEPNAKSGEFGAQPNAAENGAVSVNWGINVASTKNDGSANVNDSADAGAGNWEDSANASWATDSNWRRGVDFQRDLEASANLTTNAERFPTWNDLEANANAPTVATNGGGALNSAAFPVASNGGFASDRAAFSNATNGGIAPDSAAFPNAANGGITLDSAAFPVASNGGIAPDSAAFPVASNGGITPDSAAFPVASNGGFASDSAAFPVATNGGGAQGETTLPGVGGYAAYNNNADYRNADVANLTGVAPQFAGNSQNSGYNQVNGSENFADRATVLSPIAPIPTPNYAPVASAPAPNYVSVASTPAPNYAPVASTPAPNYASVAPTPAPSYDASGAVAEPSRAMVAQVPNESAPVGSPNVPVANPNLRW